MKPCPLEKPPHGEARFAQYLRKPDANFWLDLLRAPPPATAADAMRRERITRYVLGLATLLSLFYTVVSVAFMSTMVPVTVVNLLAAISYSVGMWMASLGLALVARRILMVTLTLHLVLLQWLTGNAVLIVLYVPLLALLARVLISPQVAGWRGLCYGVSVMLLGHALFPVVEPVLDFSVVPEPLLLLTRAGNLLITLFSALLLLGTLDREVLRSEASLVAERDRSDRLLNAVLPPTIASVLRDSPGKIADRYAEVTVLFADIVGFTPWSAQQPPEHVIDVLEDIFIRFDQLVAETGAEKIKTIGDAYMVICGAPTPRADHAMVMARLALAMQHVMHTLRHETGMPLDLRVGMHSGPVIAGVIGTVRFSFDVWGDTVNTASRMESHGEAGRIQVSQACHDLLADHFRLTARGMIDVKGKGAMTTWWLASD